ncbi:putative DNA binding protein [Pseudoalteromonas translucida]|uniref:DNA binding protein n=1 Tax=Pseudoalteromonas translucida (strain TAC 125) TaxID=326442 RepID=Q3IGK8_PSET1|nr:putative DNA binding protein [Pseudoalteromonas translucida]
MNTYVNKICETLKFERKRLGFSQEHFANLCGVTRGSQANYESGSRTPDADYLTAAIKAGCDLEFLFNGTRSKQLDEAALEDCIEILEDALVLAGRKLTAKQKARVICVLYDEYTDDGVELTAQSVVRHLRLVG